MAAIDSNTWYHWFVAGSENDALKGDILSTKDETGQDVKGPVYFEKANLTRPEHKWQFYAVNSTTYVLRNQKGRYDGFMGTKQEGKDTQALLVRGTIIDDSAYWVISPWSDGDQTFRFTNAGNGTAWHLARQKTSVIMAQDTTASQADGKFSFKSIEAINNPRYSTINLATLTMTAPMSIPTYITRTPASSLPNDRPETGGLSVGAKAGIGIGVGLLAIIAAVILGLFFWRRRQRAKSHRPYTTHASNPTCEIDDAAIKHEMYHADATKYEMPGAQRQVPVELPNSMVHQNAR